MRFLLGLSASLLLSLVGGAAMAAPATSVFDTGPLSSVVLPPNADDAAMDAAARAVLLERVPDAKHVAFGRAHPTTFVDGRRVLKLPQIHAGLPVLQRSATVTFDAQGIVHGVASMLLRDLPTDVTPQVNIVTAAATATKRAGMVADPKAGQLVIWAAGDRGHLAWRFYTPSIGLPYAPVTVIDAKDGSILAHYNAAVSLFKANVYPSNPVKSPQLTNVTLPLPDGATKLTDMLVTAKNCVDTKMATQPPGAPFVLHLCELQQLVTADPVTMDFGDKPAADNAPQDAFSELHIYHHTRKVYDYFRAFDPTFKVQAAPIDAVANLMLPAGLLELDFAKAGDPKIPFEPFQNAFFSPAGMGSQGALQSIFGITGAAMMFGQGPIKDYAYDADVIYHEFAHAAVSATVDFVGTAHPDKYGISVSPGGMNEAIADYFSATISGDPEIGEYAILDADPTSKAIRSLAGPDKCPTAIGGEVHQDASLFSGALWDVRSTLTVALQRNFDLAVFAAMKAAPSGDLGYDEFANIIIGQVKIGAMLGDPIATQLTEAFTNRGILPECARILDYTGDPMVGPLNVGGGTSIWFAPSKAMANVGTNSKGYVPGVIQVRVPLPDNTIKIKVDFRTRTLSGPPLLGGGMGTFTPKVLVRFAEQPIEFTYSPFASTDDTKVLDPTDTGMDTQEFTTYSLETDVVQGPGNAYVMIANSGDTDGVYTDLNFTFTIAPKPPPVTDEGCGCMIPGSSGTPIGFSLASVAAAAGLLARRRRK